MLHSVLFKKLENEWRTKCTKLQYLTMGFSKYSKKANTKLGLCGTNKSTR